MWVCLLRLLIIIMCKYSACSTEQKEGQASLMQPWGRALRGGSSKLD